MAGLTSDPLFVVLVLVVTVFAAGVGLPLFAASAVVSTQTVLAIRWLRRYGQGGEG